MLLKEVKPKDKNWNLFLELSFIYLNELWPKDFYNLDNFKNEYSKDLIQKIQKGNRELFLVFENKNIIGLTNVFISSKNNIKILNVAEFYIKPDFRLKGYGTKVLELLKKWGKEKNAELLKIEVDKNQKASNKFWSSFNFELKESEKRNIYIIYI